MTWIQLVNDEQLIEIKNNSSYSIIFKHSTRCSISTMAKKKFELDWDVLPKDIIFYFLDLITYRLTSNNIAEEYDIQHQSPQLLLIKAGECILEQSHGDISVDEINEILSQLK